MKHGVRSAAPVVAGLEDEADWEAFRRGIIESLHPDGHLETVLAERVACLLWRLRRAVRYETEMIALSQQAIPDDMATLAGYAERALGRPRNETLTLHAVDQQISRRLLPDADTLLKVMRYEAHLHRQYIQTLHELEALQTRRAGGHAPLARLDISAPPVS